VRLVPRVGCSAPTAASDDERDRKRELVEAHLELLQLRLQPAIHSRGEVLGRDVERFADATTERFLSHARRQVGDELLEAAAKRAVHRRESA